MSDCGKVKTKYGSSFSGTILFALQCIYSLLDDPVASCRGSRAWERSGADPRACGVFISYDVPSDQLSRPAVSHPAIFEKDQRSVAGKLCLYPGDHTAPGCGAQNPFA